jgi:hypothetical protein
MIESHSENASDSNIQIIKTESKPEEYEIHQSEGEKGQKQLIESFEENQMNKNDLYQVEIRNDIALNLHLSLYKLKRGENNEKLFKSPCQIKIYPTLKLMVIYLVVNFNFLRIKTELSSFKQNEELKNKDKFGSKKCNSKFDSQISSINLNNEFNEDKINSNVKEIIFTIELIDLFYMIDMLLCENKDNPILISIDKDFSILTGKVVCPDVYNQMMNSNQLKFNLIKNEAFSYAISNPNKINSSKNKSEVKKNDDEGNKNNINNSNIENINDNDIEIDLNNDSSQINNSESKNVKINNEQEKSNLKGNNSQNYYDSESEFLEKKFMTDLDYAKYIIEGNDLVDLYYFMKGLDLLYNDGSMHEIGISICNENAFFFCPNLKNIHDGRYIEILSKNINQQIKLNIKCVKDHYLTPFKLGFNSFYRTKFLSKFITSFYNKDDKRLLFKVSPKGKMILSYTFSDPKNDMENNQDTSNKKSISEEIKINLDNEEDDEGESTKRKKKNQKIKDRLIDDENRGNIVEMIFYPIVFDICKN